MKRKAIIPAVCALVVAALTYAGIAAAISDKAPKAVDTAKVKMRIVDTSFVQEIDGAGNLSYRQKNPDKYRGLVLTLEVTKPKGQPLTLCAQDFSVHYWYREGNALQSDVAPCLGISGFSAIKGVDRPMYLTRTARHTTKTGTATTKAGTVYVDLFFDMFEPGTRDVYLFLGQQIAPAAKTSGWKK